MFDAIDSQLFLSPHRVQFYKQTYNIQHHDERVNNKTNLTSLTCLL